MRFRRQKQANLVTMPEPGEVKHLGWFAAPVIRDQDYEPCRDSMPVVRFGVVGGTWIVDLRPEHARLIARKLLGASYEVERAQRERGGPLWSTDEWV